MKAVDDWDQGSKNENGHGEKRANTKGACEVDEKRTYPFVCFLSEQEIVQARGVRVLRLRLENFVFASERWWEKTFGESTKVRQYYGYFYLVWYVNWSSSRKLYCWNKVVIDCCCLLDCLDR